MVRDFNMLRGAVLCCIVLSCSTVRYVLCPLPAGSAGWGGFAAGRGPEPPRAPRPSPPFPNLARRARCPRRAAPPRPRLVPCLPPAISGYKSSAQGVAGRCRPVDSAEHAARAASIPARRVRVAEAARAALGWSTAFACRRRAEAAAMAGEGADAGDDGADQSRAVRQITQAGGGWR